MDSQLRTLEKYLKQHPDDFRVWYQYLGLGVREGHFDPLDFNSFITFVTQVPPVTTTLWNDQGISRQALAEMQWRRNEAEDWAKALIKSIRNTLGPQISPTRLGTIFTRTIMELFVPESRDTVVQSQPQPSTPQTGLIASLIVKDDEPDLTIGDFTAWYDEEYLHFKGIKGGEGPFQSRREVWQTKKRSILDLTPQYLLQVEVSSGGSRYEPPSSDLVMLEATTDPFELVRRYIKAREENYNQEAYLNPDLEYDFDYDWTQGSPPPPTTASLVNFAVEALRRIFRAYNYAPSVTLLEDDGRLWIVVESTSEMLWWDFKNNEITVMSSAQGASQSPKHNMKSDSEIFWWIWRSWLDARIAEIFEAIRVQGF